VKTNAFDLDNTLALVEITPDQVTDAMRTITDNATDRADLMHLLDMVRPAPHSLDPTPSARRAEPRWGI
jgi:hypothetical protein